MGDYCFQRIKSNSLEKLDEFESDRLRKLVEECDGLTKKIRNHPASVLENEILKIKSVHDNLCSKDKTKFYKDVFSTHKADAEQELKEILQRTLQKDTI